MWSGEAGPLLFAGQIDVQPAQRLRFEDLTTFFVFYDPSSAEVEIIIQQA